MKERLTLYGPLALQGVAVFLLVFAAMLSDSYVVRAIDLGLAFTVVSVASFLFGRRSAYRAIAQSTAWVPTSVSISESVDGRKVAIVEQRSGEVVSIEIPDEIKSADEAMRFILDELSDA